VFVTSPGSPHGRFQRAVERRNVLLAEAAARELGRLSLIDALSLVALYAATGSPKFEPAAVRWLARLAVEGRNVTIGDLQLAAAALGGMKGRRRAQAKRTLVALL
jgi:hypothetical protein